MMPDREKVIKGLKHCTSFDDGRDKFGGVGKCGGCPYYGHDCTDRMKTDALVLLKEQEAKCLTKAELDDLYEHQFVWIEGRTGCLFCLQIIGICRERTGVSDIQFDTPTSYVERSTNTYQKTYRIWTDKPTEEQSQAVKWE